MEGNEAVREFHALSHKFLKAATINLERELFEPALANAIHSLELAIKAVLLLKMNHPQMATIVPAYREIRLHPRKPPGFLRMNLWVSSSVLADRTAPLHLSEASFLKTKQESASPLPRRELAPEGAVES